MKRYGLIGTCYNAGISNIAWGFAENLNMKTLLVDTKPYAKFPERFANHRFTKQIDQSDIDWLLQDIDVVMAIETPYNWDVFRQAKERGVKVVFMPMIEWLDRNRPELQHVDMFLSPSKYTTRLLGPIMRPGQRLLEIPCELPVDLKKFTRRKITHAHTFLHVGGHGGIGGRNSTLELLKAIKLVKSPAKFIIRSQVPLVGKYDDPRITYIEGNVKNYWELYDQGDVWVMPWKYGAAVLGLQESMAAGLLPLITDMPPFNQFMPHDLLITPKSLEWRTWHAGQKEIYAEQSPELIAQKIDEMYNKDIRQLLNWAKTTSEMWSWNILAFEISTAFDEL